MAELNLPADLEDFLRAGKQLQYDITQVEYGELRLKSLAELEPSQVEVDLYYTPLAQTDPHAGEPGWYLMPSVVLTEPCEEYPDVQLLWLSSENLYGINDTEHRTLQVFPYTKGADIVTDPARYLNAPWDMKTQLLVYFDPSSRYDFMPLDEP